ncbi:MAG: shikimate dehydrogenase [Clostridia bacterium]|nr:shikimate dehydrogenase [Clostridia bacterium]
MLVSLENTTKKLCVIGDPVMHSKSPLIQNTMISALGLDYVYLCQPVKREDLSAWLSAAKRLGYAGFNATMPHKEDLVPLMDELDEDAKLYQSVNTVCIKENKLYGYNTDGRGFLQALADRDISPEGKRVVLLGAGGAAKAVALKLVQAGARSLVVCNRTEEKAAALCAYSDVMSTSDLAPDSLRRAAAGADLLVNCTSLGMAGTGGQFADLSFLEALPVGAAVCDLIYHPAETELLARARGLGHKTMNGLGMLIHQAIFALEYFAEVTLDRQKMRGLVESALQ